VTRRASWVVVGLGVAAAVAAIVLAAAQGGAGSVASGSAIPLVSRGALPSTAPTSAAMPGRRQGGGMRVSAGTTLEMPRLGVRAPIEPVSVSAGRMDVPADPRQVGWWSGGSRPGAAAGHAVLVGHVNYAGVPGALGVLPNAHPGDAIDVSSPGQPSARFRVVALRSYAKSTGLPGELFGSDGPPELVLITCGGPFDPSTGNYEDNIVAIAVPIVER
jgi:hypothetical protein